MKGGKEMEWLSNIYRDEDIGLSDWLQDKVIGDPKSTSEYSVSQLEDMGMVGVYRKPVERNDAT